jgi:hypothetical protein
MPEAKYYPDWFDPDEHWLPQGMLKAPPMTLIEGKFFGSQKKRVDINSPDEIVGRGGVTEVRNTDASPAKQLNWIYNQIFNFTNAGSGANLTDAQVDQAADSVQLVKRFVDELSEGLYGMPYSDPHYKRFWERIKARCLNSTPAIPYIHHHTYGGVSNIQGDPWNFMAPGGANTAPNDPVFKALLQNQAAARKKPNGDAYDFYGLFYDMGMGDNVKHYAAGPDYAADYYNKAYACEVKNLGFGQPRGIPSSKLAFVSWPNIEGLGSESGDLHNGYSYERIVPGKGRFRTEEHPEIDFDYQIGNYLMNGLCRMGGIIIFDVGSQFSPDPNLVDLRVPHTWLPDVTGTPVPAANPGYPNQPLQAHDAPFIAASQYNQCDRTAGSAWQPCEYRLEGSQTWITPPSDNTSILEHAAANDGPYSQTGRRGRLDALWREKNGAADFAMFDPSRPKHTKETVILRPIGGREFSATVTGSKPLVKNETL